MWSYILTIKMKGIDTEKNYKQFKNLLLKKDKEISKYVNVAYVNKNVVKFVSHDGDFSYDEAIKEFSTSNKNKILSTHMECVHNMYSPEPERGGERDISYYKNGKEILCIKKIYSDNKFKKQDYYVVYINEVDANKFTKKKIAKEQFMKYFSKDELEIFKKDLNAELVNIKNINELKKIYTKKVLDGIYNKDKSNWNNCILWMLDDLYAPYDYEEFDDADYDEMEDDFEEDEIKVFKDEDYIVENGLMMEDYNQFNKTFDIILNKYKVKGISKDVGEYIFALKEFYRLYVKKLDMLPEFEKMLKLTINQLERAQKEKYFIEKPSNNEIARLKEFKKIYEKLLKSFRKLYNL